MNHDAHGRNFLSCILAFTTAVQLQPDDMHDWLAVLLLIVSYDLLVAKDIEACIGCWLCPISDARSFSFSIADFVLLEFRLRWNLEALRPSSDDKFATANDRRAVRSTPLQRKQAELLARGYFSSEPLRPLPSRFRLVNFASKPD